MVETDQIAEEEAASARQAPLRYAPPQTVMNKAPYFSDYVKAELLQSVKGRLADGDVAGASLKVYTTLDPLQNAAAGRAVADGVAALEKKLNLAATDRLEGALAAVEPATGYLRALVGGKNYANSSFNRILNMRRQVGSTFKPVVYLTAIRKGQDASGIPYGGAYPLWDGPWKLIYDSGRQTWEPKNYEKGYRGWTTFRESLARSINTTTAKLGADLGVESIIETARMLGVTSDLPSVPSLALGVAELTPVELLRIYATVANHGTQLKLVTIRLITDDAGATVLENVAEPRPALPAEMTDLLTQLLRSVFTDGTATEMAKALAWTRPAAGKTGTTSHHRDAWFAGFTPQLTTVVWVGKDLENSAPSKISLTGGGSAFPIWASFMKNALTGEAVEDFAAPPGISEVLVDLHTGWSARAGCSIEQVRTDTYLTSQLTGRETCESRPPEPERVTEKK
jgi:membrane peptidoglycan carboxypeptidase